METLLVPNFFGVVNDVNKKSILAMIGVLILVLIFSLVCAVAEGNRDGGGGCH